MFDNSFSANLFFRSVAFLKSSSLSGSTPEVCRVRILSTSSEEVFAQSILLFLANGSNANPCEVVVAVCTSPLFNCWGFKFNSARSRSACVGSVASKSSISAPIPKVVLMLPSGSPVIRILPSGLFLFKRIGGAWSGLAPVTKSSVTVTSDRLTFWSSKSFWITPMASVPWISTSLVTYAMAAVFVGSIPKRVAIEVAIRWFFRASASFLACAAARRLASAAFSFLASRSSRRFSSA